MKALHTAALAIFTLLFITSILCTVQVNAAPTITLSLHKDFGYSSFGNDAQGNWTAHVTTSQDTTRVEFYLDNQLQLNDTQTPFAWPYYTNNFSEGLHTILAVAYDASGNQAEATAEQNFVEFPSDFFIYIIMAVVAIVIVSIVVALVMMQRRKTNSAKR
jgi:hypothetical protein